MAAADPARQIPIESICHGGRHIDDAQELVDSATAHFKDRFQLPYRDRSPEVLTARAKLLRHVRRLPKAAADRLEVGAMLTDQNIVEAIRSMPTGKMPGSDGMPVDWYIAFAAEIASLLRELYMDCLRKGEMTKLMRMYVHD